MEIQVESPRFVFELVFLDWWTVKRENGTFWNECPLRVSKSCALESGKTWQPKSLFRRGMRRFKGVLFLRGRYWGRNPGTAMQWPCLCHDILCGYMKDYILLCDDLCPHHACDYEETYCCCRLPGSKINGARKEGDLHPMSIWIALERGMMVGAYTAGASKRGCAWGRSGAEKMSGGGAEAGHRA